MCLIVIAHRHSPDYPLIVAANRDEFHVRPTQDAHWWPDKPKLLGGRDQQAGGTWLALHQNGRFAAVTNFRDAAKPSPKLRSRGHLITEFLESESTAPKYLQGIVGDDYAGFNLLISDGNELAYLSNRGGGLQVLPPGIYGVANATLDTPWAKVERSKSVLHDLIDSGRVNETNLLRMLNDRNKAAVRDVEAGHLSFAKAHAMSSPFIVQPDYGTRCSSVLLRDKSGRVQFTEVRFGSDGRERGRSDFALDINT